MALVRVREGCVGISAGFAYHGATTTRRRHNFPSARVEIAISLLTLIFHTRKKDSVE